MIMIVQFFTFCSSALFFCLQDRNRPFDAFSLHSLENSLMDMIRTDHDKGKPHPAGGPPMTMADIIWRNHFAGQEYLYVHALIFLASHIISIFFSLYQPISKTIQGGLPCLILPANPIVVTYNILYVWFFCTMSFCSLIFFMPI